MYIYKALFETFEGNEYTLFGMEKNLPELDVNYLVIGEIVSTDITHKTKEKIGDIKGQLISVTDIKRLSNLEEGSKFT